MRAHRAKKKAGGTVLLPKAFVRRLNAQGITPLRYLGVVPVSLDDYRAQQRLLDAKIARVEWQSSGIQKLQAQVEGHSERIMLLEGDLARLEAMMDSVIMEER